MASFFVSLTDTEDVSGQTGAESSSSSSSSGDSTYQVSAKSGSDSSSSNESDSEVLVNEVIAKRPPHALQGLVQQTSADATNNRI